jgi:hypothetical protein
LLRVALDQTDNGKIDQLIQNSDTLIANDKIIINKINILKPTKPDTPTQSSKPPQNETDNPAMSGDTNGDDKINVVSLVFNIINFILISIVIVYSMCFNNNKRGNVQKKEGA